MPSSIDIVMQNKIIGINPIVIFTILIHVKQISTLKMRIEYQRVAILHNTAPILYWRQIALDFTIQIYISNLHKHISEILSFDCLLKSTIIQLSLTVNLP